MSPSHQADSCWSVVLLTAAEVFTSLTAFQVSCCFLFAFVVRDPVEASRAVVSLEEGVGGCLSQHLSLGFQLKLSFCFKMTKGFLCMLRNDETAVVLHVQHQPLIIKMQVTLCSSAILKNETIYLIKESIRRIHFPGYQC